MRGGHGDFFIRLCVLCASLAPSAVKLRKVISSYVSPMKQPHHHIFWQAVPRTQAFWKLRVSDVRRRPALHGKTSDQNPQMQRLWRLFPSVRLHAAGCRAVRPDRSYIGNKSDFPYIWHYRLDIFPFLTSD